MMRSLFAGVSGLRNHQTRMDVIGNNIANVNTVGFKASRVNFQDVLSQTIQGASSGSGNRGGTNPIQVGLGMGLSSIDTLFTDGSSQPTGKPTDLAIQGQGFFILSDGATQVYTRSGNFDFDTNGNYLVPGTGLKVMGWQADKNGNIDTSSTISSIQVPVGKTMPAKASTSITYANNLSGDAKIGDKVPASMDVYDSKGNVHTVDGVFENTGVNQWKLTVSTTTPAATASYTLDFNTDGSFKPPATPYTAFSFSPAGAATVNITLDLAGLTQHGGESTAKALDQDGYAAGTLDTVSIAPSGVVIGRFTNGKTQNLAQVALAVFNNPAGLNKYGNNMFAKSNNSGEAQVGPSGSGGRGLFIPGSLEMSNVDLAQEFSNMIITQRGFQANSKIITTTDQMLEELANLKR